MSENLSRRSFGKGAAAGAVLANLGDWSFLSGLRPVTAQETNVKRSLVQFRPEIEPLVGLIEETERSKLLERVVGLIRKGTSYQELLAAVMLAGVRGIQPRPVGFKFHAVLVVNSAHLASLASTDQDRWLPLLWAIDNYKGAQARNRQEGDWSMAPVAEGKLPPANAARRRFVEAIDQWDEAAADRAVVTFVRTAGATEVIETFWRYGARDFRDIGHKAIYVANAWRTLQTIGWQHAEPIMRSLAYALLDRGGEANPATSDLPADRPGRENGKRSAAIRADWQSGKLDPAATTELLAALRTADPAQAAGHVVEMLNKKVDPASVWDALFLTAGEQLMRQPGIVGLHCVTCTNAMHFAYQTSGVDDTRKFVTLQAAAFLTMFREAMTRRGAVRTDIRLDALEPISVSGKSEAAVADIFATVSQDRMKAAGKTLALFETAPQFQQAWFQTARRLIFAKGTDSHDYKFSSAALEDFHSATPAVRNRLLAASVFHLRGSGGVDNPLIAAARGLMRSS